MYRISINSFLGLSIDILHNIAYEIKNILYVYIVCIICISLSYS